MEASGAAPSGSAQSHHGNCGLPMPCWPRAGLPPGADLWGVTLFVSGPCRLAGGASRCSPQTGLSARLIPATIALGAFTFTMTALPGTPSIQNAIPMATFGTTPFAAPGLGLIAGAVMLVLGLGWLRYRARALVGEAPPEAPDSPPRDRPLPLWVALVPILSVGPVTLAMALLVLPAQDTGYLALPNYGATDLSRVGGLWSVITALSVALALALVINRPPQLMAVLNEGAESALLPLFNTASLVGFGAVIASLPGFGMLRASLEGLSAGNVVISAALSSGALAGITGSASGGNVDSRSTCWGHHCWCRQRRRGWSRRFCTGLCRWRRAGWTRCPTTARSSRFWAFAA